MSRVLALTLFVVAAAAAVHARQQPLSPPARPPVPLTDLDQQRAREEELAKAKTASATSVAHSASATGSALQIRVTSGDRAIDAVVYQAALVYGLDPQLIFSVMKAESGFSRGAVSPKGASGLMQLMPGTAARLGVKNIFDVRENIFGGARYLRWLLERFNGDVRLALAAYNAGEGAVELYGNRIPPFFETQAYVRSIYSRYTVFVSGRPLPKTLDPAAIQGASLADKKIPTYNQILRFSASSEASDKPKPSP